ncbi:DUF7537 family lipoprotein [Halocatena marina]
MGEYAKTSMIPPMVSESTVENFTMTALVDSDGLVRSSTYEITYTTSEGETHSRTGSIRFNGADTTTVTEPAWVEEAQAES